MNRGEEVPRLLLSHTRIDALLLRLAIAETLRGVPSAAAHSAELTRRFDEARLRQSTLHQREEARFELAVRKRPERALQLSLENFGVQREVWDIRIALEAALACAKPDSVKHVIAFVKEAGLEEPAIARLVRSLEAA